VSIRWGAPRYTCVHSRPERVNGQSKHPNDPPDAFHGCCCCRCRPHNCRRADPFLPFTHNKTLLPLRAVRPLGSRSRTPNVPTSQQQLQANSPALIMPRMADPATTTASGDGGCCAQCQATDVPLLSPDEPVGMAPQPGSNKPRYVCAAVLYLVESMNESIASLRALRCCCTVFVAVVAAAAAAVPVCSGCDRLFLPLFLSLSHTLSLAPLASPGLSLSSTPMCVHTYTFTSVYTHVHTNTATATRA
jgi:hypothetical protein